MIDKISDNLAYMLCELKLIKEDKFETVSLILGTVLFAFFSTSIFLVIGIAITGSIMDTIRVMLIFNTLLNIMNFKLQFHASKYEICILLTGISLVLLFTLSTIATSILNVFLGSTRGVMFFDIVSTIMFLKWFLDPKTRARIRHIERTIFKVNKQ